MRLLTLFLTILIILIQFWKTAYGMKYLQLSLVSRYIFCCYDPEIPKIHLDKVFLSFFECWLKWQTKDVKARKTGDYFID